MRLRDGSSSTVTNLHIMESFWWSGDPDEIYCMEITRRRDIGGDLGAPLEARGGVTTPGYALMHEVRPGDVVIHYDSIARSIVGVSRVTGEAYYEPIWWVARGSYARAAGAQERYVPGIWIPLDAYTPASPPIDRPALVERADAILRVEEALSAAHGGAATYFPFTKAYKISAWQSYLAKFPKDLLGQMPELQLPIAKVMGLDLEAAPIMSEADQAKDEIDEAAGKRRPARRAGQGRRVDPEVKAAVEAHAMNAAREHYESLGGVVTDTSKGNPYDYSVDLGGEEWHVEVKGTQTTGTSVLLTIGEVRHHQEFPNTALFVLSNIDIDRSSGAPVASGGQATILHPWALDGGPLVPTGYEWTLPVV